MGNNVTQLAGVLKNGVASYHYRHNYPLARIIAMSLFMSFSPDNLKTFFASRQTALETLNIPKIMKGLQRCVVVPSKSGLSETEVDKTTEI